MIRDRSVYWSTDCSLVSALVMGGTRTKSTLCAFQAECLGPNTPGVLIDQNGVVL